MSCHDSPWLLASISNSYDITIGYTYDCDLRNHNTILNDCNDKLKANNDYLRIDQTTGYLHAGHGRTNLH